jgi:SAM-dependent methyltransferase
MSDHRWAESFFRGVGADFWNEFVPPELTAAEVGFLTDAFELADNARVLDVPCGNGRHAIEFARQGHRVTAIDISPDFLAMARRSADAAGVRVDWIEADMIEVPAAAAFDAGYCWGNSFGYLDHARTRSFLGALARALRPGARFVADIATAAESLLPNLIPRQWHRSGGTFVLSDARYDASSGRLDIDYTFVRDGIADTRRATSYVMTAAECARLFHAAGFDVIDTHGSIAGEPYTIGSPRLLLVAQRK